MIKTWMDTLSQYTQLDSVKSNREDVRQEKCKFPSDAFQRHILMPMINFINVLESMDRNSSTAMQQVKYLELCISGLRRHTSEDTLLDYYWKDLCNICVDVIFCVTLEPKVLRKAFTVMMELEKLHKEKIKKNLFSYVKHLQEEKVTTEVLCLWSQLIDASASARSIVYDTRSCLLVSLAIGLQVEMDTEESWTLVRQEALHVRVKLVVQIMQHYSDSISQLLWQAEMTSTDDQSAMCSVLRSLVIILQKEDSPRDSSLLAGTALALAMNFSPSVDITTSLVLKLYSSLTASSESQIPVGNLKLSIPTSTTKNSSQTFGQMALLNGIVPCASSALLGQKIDGNENLAEWIYIKITSLCSCTVFQYHTFRVLLQWFGKCRSIAASNTKVLVSVTDPTMHLVWTHLDSPVDGVNETVMEIFKALLLALNEMSTSCDDADAEKGFSYDAFLSDTKSAALKMLWSVKGKHIMLATLMPYVDIEQFLHDQGDAMWKSFLECLATNFLTQPCTQLYKAILQAIRSTHDSVKALEVWQRLCLPQLVRGLLSEEYLVCHNTCLLWLPWTLKTLPQSFTVLMEYMENRLTQQDSQGQREAYLRAIIAVCKVGRQNHLLKSIPEHYVSEALYHMNHDLRLDAFALLCVSPRKAEPLSCAEVSILKRTLPVSMNIDCSPFRQQLQGLLRSLMVRARDSGLAQMRAKHMDEQILHQSIDFLDWLWCECIKHVQPGGSFQRTKTCLEWMWVILDSIGYSPTRKQRKGGCPETSVNLVSYAQSQGKLDLFSETCSQTILACLLNGTDDIRDLAHSILTIFFPWPLPAPGGLLPSTVMVRTALNLCRSPQAQQSDSGALCAKMICEKFILGKGETYVINGDEVQPGSRMLPQEAALSFFYILLLQIEAGVEKAKSNTLAAAKSYPIHGLTLALQQCMSCPGLVIPPSSEEWRGFFRRLLEVIHSAMELSRQVLGGKVHDGQETAPSFEEMGRAIAAVITESGGGMEEEDEDESTLSAEHQMLMTSAWISIKETSVLIGRMVSCVPCGDDAVLSVQQVKELGDLLFNVLTKCRHRGAIEGCNVGFTSYCSALLSDGRQCFYSLPAELMEQVLTQATDTEASSVTRRSAGLPLIAQSILSSESKAKQSLLLNRCLTRLLSVLDLPIPEEVDERRDLPQVHALNILRALFGEASLTAGCRPHLAVATVHAVRGFASPVWAIRNSATQLFSTLLNRMFGQKKTRADHLSTTTAAEFFTHYPQLEGFVLAQVEEAVSEHSTGGKLHPSLFPVLSILAKLGRGTATEGGIRFMTTLEPVVRSLAPSPIYGVRELAAQALVPLVSSPEHFLHGLVIELPSRMEDGLQRMNWVHGTLLQIERLLKAINAISTSTLQSLLDRSWLCGPANPCHLVRGNFLQVLGLTTEKCKENMEEEIQEKVEKLIRTLMEDMTGKNEQENLVTIGYDLYVRSLVVVWLSHCLGDPTPLLLRCLAATHVRETLLATVKADSNVWKTITPTLVSLLTDTTSLLHVEAQQNVLNLLLHLHLCGCTFHAPAALYPHLLTVVQREASSRTGALALALSAVMVNREPTAYDLVSWCNLLEKCSDPAGSDLLRLQTARSIRIAGEAVLTTLPQVQVSILRCCISLLLDQQPDVRFIVSDFIQRLPWKHQCKYPVIHPNFALQMAFTHWAEVYSHNALLQYLLQLLQWSGDITETLHNANNQQVDDLFSPQDLNPYREKVVLDQLAVATIKKMMESHSEQEMNDTLEKQIETVDMRLKSVYETLPSISEASSSFLGVTCDRDGFSCIHGLYCEAGLALWWYRLHGQKEHVNSLKVLLEMHLKIPLLHPALRRCIQNAIDN